MLIEIRPEIFDDAENFEEFTFLLRILSYRHRYNFFSDFTEIQTKELFQQLPQIDKGILEEYFNRQITSSQKPNYFVTENGDGDLCYQIRDAIRFFNQRFNIILENSLNDGYFLDSLVNTFKKKGKIIKRHKEEGWIDYTNGGGKNNISNHIESMLKEYDLLQKKNHDYLRCFVLIDGDKEFPSQIKKDKVILIDFLEKYGIPYHVLEKREMENYLPDEVWADVDAKPEFTEAYSQLTPVQKDFFDIECGFDNKNIKSLDQEIQALYNSVPEANINILRKGIEMGYSYKSKFPKYFLNEKVTQEALKKRTSHQNEPDELPNLLEKISNFL